MRRQWAGPESITVHAVGDDGGGAAKLLRQNALNSLRDCCQSHRQMHDHVEQLVLLLVIVLNLHKATLLQTCCLSNPCLTSCCMSKCACYHDCSRGVSTRMSGCSSMHDDQLTLGNSLPASITVISVKLLKDCPVTKTSASNSLCLHACRCCAMQRDCRCMLDKYAARGDVCRPGT